MLLNRHFALTVALADETVPSGEGALERPTDRGGTKSSERGKALLRSASSNREETRPLTKRIHALHFAEEGASLVF